MIGRTMGGHMLGILRIEIKHVNHKTCVHQISECNCRASASVIVCGHVSAGVCSGGSTM